MTTQLQSKTQALVSYLLWDDENWKHLVQSSPAADALDGDAFVSEWENRNDPSSPFHNHIATDALLLYEEVFGEKALDFVVLQAKEEGFAFASEED